MARTIEYLPEAERDLELIFDHLYESYCAFGDLPNEAVARARQRMAKLRQDTRRLTVTPFVGTLRSDIYPGLRFVRRNSAAVWFLADEEHGNLLIVAVFFGSQDHIRRMMARLLDIG